MAFDVYVGTITRFARGEWENVGERMAREMGANYEQIHVGGEPAPPDASEIRQAVQDWCTVLGEAIEPHGHGPVAWDEGDEQPYFTERPGWEGYGALRLWAAYVGLGERPPEQVPESPFEDPVLERALDPESGCHYGEIVAADLWIPAELPGILQGASPFSDTSSVGSVFALREELQHLRETTADALAEKPAAPDPAALDPAAADAEPTLAERADHGLTLFAELADHACQHRLPMLLSF